MAEEVVLDEQHRAYAAVGRGSRQVDGQVELPGQLADRGQAHPGRVAELGEQNRVAPGHHPLCVGPFVRGHADTGVVDGDRDSVVGAFEVHRDGGVGRGVPQRVVEQLGDDDRDRLDGVRDERGALFEVVVDLDPVVADEPGLAAGHRVDQVRLLTGQPHPGPAHDGGDLRAAQGLLVLVVECEEVLRQVGVVVALLQPAEYVLQPIEPGLDLPCGTAHTGAGGGVDPLALLRHRGQQPGNHAVHSGAQLGPGELRVQGAGHLDMRMRGAGGLGRNTPLREMDHLGGERLRGAVDLLPRDVQMGAQGGDLLALPGPLTTGTQQPAPQSECRQRPGGQAADGQVRYLDHRIDLGEGKGVGPYGGGPAQYTLPSTGRAPL
ncbi:hypothetical protein OOK40_34510 [Streptomyces sp. NBC_01481]|nr:hypothetical protein [Streptomyces sp. NBC_01481]